MAGKNPFEYTKTSLKVGDTEYSYYDLNKLNDKRLQNLPVSIRILLESVVRNGDGFVFKKSDVETVLAWETTAPQKKEIPFGPSRVLLQDFTGVPAVVDLAAMRSALSRLGGDPKKVPADLVIDHSVQVDHFGTKEALLRNQKREMERNHERFQFLKWGSKAFSDFKIVPPGAGIVHQVNLEYLARVVFNKDKVLYPDSLVGTDSHSTMINGLGVTGWGVGGIEAESVLCGQAITMVLPEVVGYKLTGSLGSGVTATDMVLTIVKNLRAFGVVGKFVEFYGEGLKELSLADRATIANMAPEYGATMGFFPVDFRTMEYLKTSDRSDEQLVYIEKYLRANGMFIDYDNPMPTPKYTHHMELDLSTVVPCVSGPKRPHDYLPLKGLAAEFVESLGKKGFAGFDLPAAEHKNSGKFTYNDVEYTLKHGDIAIAAITSCTNTSNPSVMLGAGLLAKKAVERGLTVKPFVKTSLAPGSHVVSEYLSKSGLQPYLDKLGFNVVGFGCTSCIGNSGDIVPEVAKTIQDNNLVCSAVLSGNRNFEGRVHNLTRATYLASPPLVVAFALAGTVALDFETKPIGTDKDGKPVFLKEIWPSSNEIQAFVEKYVVRDMFHSVYQSILNGTEEWNKLKAEPTELYDWDEKSTYIQHPPFFQTMEKAPPGISNVKDAAVLLNLGDSITTDHISPAGRIARNSPAARYLSDKDIKPRDFNTYGSRRGNDRVMARGTFANVRLVNKFCEKPGPRTVHIPSNTEMSIFDASAKYLEAKTDLIILAGSAYGSGSSRDWAAKGPFLLGVKAVIATSYERIHRSNLVGMGIVPLQFKKGQDTESLGLSGKEKFNIDFTSSELKVGQTIVVQAGDKKFETTLRLDTEIEIEYIKHGGILNYCIRQLL